MKEPIANVLRITPDDARKLLNANTNNRNIRESRVEQHVGTIERGEWRLTGDAICIAEDGRILNGQHRLEALVRTNKPLLFTVLRNCPEESFDVMDQGTPRTNVDVLRSAYTRNPFEVGATCRYLYYWFAGSAPGENSSHSPAPTPVQVKQIYKENRDRVDACVALGMSCKSIYAASRIAFVQFRIQSVRSDQAGSEFWQLVNPKCPHGLPIHHPARPLRDYMIMTPHARKMECRHFDRIAVTAFNRFVEGSPLPESVIKKAVADKEEHPDPTNAPLSPTWRFTEEA